MKKALLILLIIVFVFPITLYAWEDDYDTRRSKRNQEREGEIYRERLEQEKMERRLQELEDRQDRIERGKNPNDSTGEELIRRRPSKFSPLY